MHHARLKMPELEKKYVDGSEYYGNTTYLWQNMRVLGIIVGCKSTSQSRGERFLTEDLFFLVRILRVPRSFVRIVHTEVLFYYIY